MSKCLRFEDLKEGTQFVNHDRRDGDPIRTVLYVGEQSAFVKYEDGQEGSVDSVLFRKGLFIRYEEPLKYTCTLLRHKSGVFVLGRPTADTKTLGFVTFTVAGDKLISAEVRKEP